MYTLLKPHPISHTHPKFTSFAFRQAKHLHYHNYHFSHPYLWAHQARRHRLLQVKIHFPDLIHLSGAGLLPSRAVQFIPFVQMDGASPAFEPHVRCGLLFEPVLLNEYGKRNLLLSHAYLFFPGRLPPYLFPSIYRTQQIDPLLHLFLQGSEVCGVLQVLLELQVGAKAQVKRPGG